MDADLLAMVSRRAIELCAAEGRRFVLTEAHWHRAQRELVGEDWEPSHLAAQSKLGPAGLKIPEITAFA